MTFIIVNDSEQRIKLSNSCRFEFDFSDWNIGNFKHDRKIIRMGYKNFLISNNAREYNQICQVFNTSNIETYDKIMIYAPFDNFTSMIISNIFYNILQKT